MSGKTYRLLRRIFCLTFLILTATLRISAQLRLPVRIMELNCENLFDDRHDSLKNDYEFMPKGSRHWTWGRYYRKLNCIAKEIMACTDTTTMRPPDLVALCEVENDSVMRGLTRLSALRYSGYDFFVTSSPDLRGIDVALLYNPRIFIPIAHYPMRIAPPRGMRPTRDVLYVCGSIAADTFHIFVLHAPSRQGGAKATLPYRNRVAERVIAAIDSIRVGNPLANIIKETSI